MSSTSLPCPGCGKRVTLPDRPHGATTRCPSCNCVVPALRSGTGPLPVSSTDRDAVPAVWTVGDVLLGVYEVRQVHETGGMGLVYRVHHRGLNIDFAVKTPRPEFFATEQHRENFVREADTWVNLGMHPHVVTCFYIRTLGGIPRVFAEYVDGGSLAEWVRTKKLYEGGSQAALERILDLSIQFAWGLQFAHEQGLVHQDVKPANVLVTQDGLAKVTDFGLAKARGVTNESHIGGGARSVLRSVGGMTAGYCSPEQADRKPVGRATDVWSWGVSLLEMFAGEIRWMSGVAAGEALEELAENPPEDRILPGMPDLVRKLLEKCFRFDPNERWGSLGEASGELERIYQESVGRPYPRPKPRSLDVRAAGLNNRGVSMYDLGRGEEAEKFFGQALKEDPHHIEATYNRDLLAWRRGEITDQDRLRNLEALRQSHEGEWTLRYFLGLVQLGRGAAEQAARELAEAVRRRPQEAGIWVRRGDAEMALERPGEARKAYQKAVQLAPANLDARAGLALALHQLGKEGEAEGTWTTIAPRLPAPRWPWKALREATRKAVFPRIREVARHRAPTVIRSLSPSPDGNLVAVTGDDGPIRILDPKDGRCPQTLGGHPGGTRAIAFSPDGRTILSGGADGRIQVWDLVTGSSVRTLAGHEGPVLALYWGAEIASAGVDGRVRKWNPTTGRAVETTVVSSPGTTGASFSEEGAHVAVVERDGIVRVAGREIGRARIACLSPDGRSVALAGESVMVCEIEAGRRVEIRAPGVRTLAWSRNGKSVITAGEDETLRVWEAWRGRCMSTLTGGPAAGCAVLSGRTLFAGFGAELTVFEVRAKGVEEEPQISVIEDTRSQQEAGEKVRTALARASTLLEEGKPAEAMETACEVRRIAGYERHAEALDLCEAAGRRGRRARFVAAWDRGEVAARGEPFWLREGLRVVEQQKDGKLQVRDSTTVLATLLQACSSVTAVALSSDGRQLLVGNARGQVELWDVRMGGKLRLWETAIGQVSAVAFGPGGRRVAAGMAGSVWNSRGDALSTSDEFRVRRGPLEGALFSPDGELILAFGDDGTLRIRRTGKGAKVLNLWAHRGGVRAAAWMGEGLQIASGGADGTLAIWDAVRGTQVDRFEGHVGPVTAVAVTGDGGWILSGAGDGTLRLWEVSSGACLWKGEGQGRSVLRLALGPSGRFVASMEEGGQVRVWELDWEYDFRARDLGGALERRLAVLLRRDKGSAEGLGEELADAGLGGVPASEVERRLATRRSVWTSGRGRESPIVRAAAKRRRVRRFMVAAAAVALALMGGGLLAPRWRSESPTGTGSSAPSLAPGSSAPSSERDSKYESVLQQAEAALAARRLDEAFSRFSEAALLRQGDTSAAAGLRRVSEERRRDLDYAGAIADARGAERKEDWVAARKAYERALQAKSGDNAAKRGLADLGAKGVSEPVHSDHEGPVMTVAFRADGKALASGSYDKKVKVWDVESGKVRRTLAGHLDWVLSVGFSPDGKVLASASGDQSIRLWGADTGQDARTLTGHSDCVYSLTFRPDGRFLASGGGDATVRVWDLESGLERRTLTGHSKKVTSTAFHPEGRVLASASADATVKLWEVETGRELRTLTGHEGLVYGVAFSVGGDVLASGSLDRTVRLWDAETGRELRTLTGHSGSVYSVAFHPEGRILASASADATVRLWDAETGRELRTLTGHSGAVYSVAFQPGGRVLASASGDKTVRFWGDAVPAGEAPSPVPAVPDPPRAAAESVEAPARWEKAIDLLPYIDPARDSVRGIWRRQGEGLLSDATGMANVGIGAARIEIPYQPPEEYDFRIVFTRLEGNDSVSQILSRSGAGFAWKMGDYENKIFAFEAVNGLNSIDNATTRKVEPCLEAGKMHTSVVQVRRDAVAAFVDGHLRGEWKPSQGALGPAIRLWSLRDGGLLGVGTWKSPTLFHRMDVLEISGKGRFIRGPRRPVPDAASLRDAEAALRNSSLVTQARLPKEKAELGRKLLKTAEIPGPRDVQLFALLRQAARLASEGGDARTALAAVDGLSAGFDVDEFGEKVDLFLNAPMRGSDAGPWVRSCLFLAERASGLDRYDLAVRLAGRGESLASTGKETAIRDEARECGREYADLRREWEALAAFRKTLATQPDDPVANGAMGKFVCLVREEWEKGLPLLAKGAGPLKKLAEQELARPSAMAARAALGEAWAVFGDQELGRYKSGARARAREWLEKAMPDLAGTARSAAERRLASLGPPAGRRNRQVDLGTGSTMELVYIRPGTFTMGDAEAPVGRDGEDERPPHPVTISRGFYLAKFEVTRGQFGAFVKATGYRTEAEIEGDMFIRRLDGSLARIAGATWKDPMVPGSFDDDHPVIGVSWNDAKAFCAWMANLTGREVRLPTEAEWEFACRAGTSTRWSFATVDDSMKEHGWSLTNAWSTNAVGQKKPNPWGLYDMHGNVSEWCEDWSGSYELGAQCDPTGPPIGTERCHRGGSWFVLPARCRSASREAAAPSLRFTFLGFRVAMR